MYALLGTHQEEALERMASRLITRMGYEVTIVSSVDSMLEAMGVRPDSDDVSEKFQFYTMDVNLGYPASLRLEALKILPHVPQGTRLVTFSGNSETIRLAQEAGLEAYTTPNLIKAFR